MNFLSIFAKNARLNIVLVLVLVLKSKGLAKRSQHFNTTDLATLLRTTCCVRLATLLRYVAICCNMLDDVGSNLKTVKFFLQHFGYVHATLLH